MAEETVVAEPIRGLPGMQVITPEGNLFQDDGGSASQPASTPEPAKPNKPEPPAKTDNEEIVDELEYLERQTGYKSWDDVKALKTEVEQLRTKAQTPAEIKFVNEHSQKLFEAWKEGKEDDVYSYLDNKRKLASAANLPAADAIKLHLQHTNPHYKPEDVEDVFEERYALPKKPVQGIGEDPDDFQERMTEYTTRVGKVNRAIERDAVAAKADLANRITQLVPPEIPKREQENQGPSQEVLEGRRNFIDNFIKTIPKELEGLKGFNTTFKDDVVEIPIAYGVTPEEAQVYKDKLEGFAKKNLDVNTLFSERWVNKDGTINAKQVAEDLYLLDNQDKIFKKIATESGMKRLEHQIKLNSNINVTGETKVVTMAKSEPASQKEAIDQLWANA